MTLEEYIEQHSTPENEVLQTITRSTYNHVLNPHMLSGHVQGRVLSMLSHMIRPHRVLELGTFTGYSALCLAEGLPPGGHVWTFEANDEMEDFARHWIEGSTLSDRITLIIGDANVEAPRLGITFDMAFIDGDKRTYCQCYDTVLPLLRPGGFIIADNTLWDGHVVDHAYDHDRQTQGIELFNDYVASDSRTEQVILPLRDGLTIVRKLKN